MYIISPNFSDLLKSNCEIKSFPDGDSFVSIPDSESVKNQEVILFHRLYPDQNSSLIQAFFLLSILRKSGAKTTLVSPYLPYSRQDKPLPGESASAEEICAMLSNAGASKLVTLDCHFLKKPGTFTYAGLQIENISMAEKLIGYAKKIAGSELFIISPDAGAGYMTGHNGKSMKKMRGDYVSGAETYRRIEKLEADFDVSGKSILIIDDMIASGGTMIKAVENLKHGGAEKIYCAATHGFFLKDSFEKLNGICDAVFTTNSIPSPASRVNLLSVLEKYGDLPVR